MFYRMAHQQPYSKAAVSHAPKITYAGICDHPHNDGDCLMGLPQPPLNIRLEILKMRLFTHNEEENKGFFVHRSDRASTCPKPASFTKKPNFLIF